MYLIHLSQPLANSRNSVRHYIGWAIDVDRRFSEHEKGNGSALLAQAVKEGITFRLVRTWKGSRKLERALKVQRNSPRHCPICNGIACVFEDKER